MNNYKYIDIQLQNDVKNHNLTLNNCICIVTTDLDTLIQNREVFLHPSELKELASMQYPRRQISYLRGRYAAKLALQYLDIGLKLNEIGIHNGVFGFPYINPPLAVNNQVSISHNDITAFAVAFNQSHPMAIDVEQVPNDRIEAIKSQMLDKELDLAINSMIDEDTALTLFWTAKEALSKIIKCGLWIDYKLLEISTFEGVSNHYVCKFKNFPQYKTNSFVYKDNVFSLILPAKNYVFFPDVS